MPFIERPALNPARLPGVVAWWDFSDLRALTFSGSIVSGVRDKSGRGNNLTYVSGTSTAGLSTVQGRNLTALLGQDQSGNNKIGFTTPLTVSAGDLMISYAAMAPTSVGTYQGFPQRVIQGAGSNWLVGPWQGQMNFYGSSSFLPTTQNEPLNAWYVHTAAISTAQSLFLHWFNGALLGTSGMQSYPGQMAVGFAGLWNEPPGANLGEIIITRSYAEPSRRQLERYLAGKWKTAPALAQGLVSPPTIRRQYYAAAAGGISFAASAGVGAITVTGAAAVVTAGAALSPSNGAVLTTGRTPTVAAGAALSATAGAVTITGQAATISVGAALSPPPGSIVVTGPAATIAAAASLAPGIGAVAAAGQSATIAAGAAMLPPHGAITTTGQTASVSAGGSFSAAANPGAITITGQTGSVTAGVVLSPAPGAVTATGQTASVSAGGSFAASVGVGAVVITGLQASVSAGVAAAAAAGAISVSGRGPALSWGFAGAAGVGVLAVTGRVPTITAGGAYTPSPRRTITAPATTRAILAPARPRTIIVP